MFDALFLFSVYQDRYGRFWKDKQAKQFVDFSLYLHDASQQYFLDFELTQLVVIVELGSNVPVPPPSVVQSITEEKLPDLPDGTLPTPPVTVDEDPSEVNHVSKMSTKMTDQHVLFIIGEMRTAIANEDRAPANLRELDQQISAAKGTKRALFKSMADQMNKTFLTNFNWTTLQRKWIGLIDTYKKKKDSQARTGAAYIKFRFFEQMDNLLSGHHDITPEVTAGPSGVAYHRRPEPAADLPLPDPNIVPPVVPGPELGLPKPAEGQRHRRRAAVEDPLLHYLRERDEAYDRFRTDLLQEMANTRNIFENLLEKLNM